jgi:hypothetical protein
MDSMIWLLLGLAWAKWLCTLIWFLVHCQWQSAIAAFLILLLLEWVSGHLARALKD